LCFTGAKLGLSLCGGTQTEGFENGELRKILVPKMEEEKLLRKLHLDELHSLYF
jgi:hypothetical protein